MGYDPHNAKEQPRLPPDTILNGVIINITDGQVKDFIKSEKWEGDLQNPAIDITTEVLHQNNKYTFSQVMTYKEEQGTTVYAPNSNMGRYKKKYGKLPEVGDQVKVITDKDGFLKLKLD